MVKEEKGAVSPGRHCLHEVACIVPGFVERGGAHEQDAFPHVLGQAGHARRPVQRLAILDDGDLAAQRAQVPRGVVVQVLRTCMPAPSIPPEAAHM